MSKENDHNKEVIMVETPDKVTYQLIAGNMATFFQILIEAGGQIPTDEARKKFLEKME